MSSLEVMVNNILANKVLAAQLNMHKLIYPANLPSEERKWAFMVMSLLFQFCEDQMWVNRFEVMANSILANQVPWAAPSNVYGMAQKRNSSEISW